MIELFFLLIIIPRRVWVLAKARNQSALKWSLAAIGAWIGAEILMGAIIGILTVVLSQLGFFPQGNASAVFYIVTYLLILAAAATGATLIIRQLRKKPLIEGGSNETTQT
jgi:hypothetical protein